MSVIVYYWWLNFILYVVQYPLREIKYWIELSGVINNKTKYVLIYVWLMTLFKMVGSVSFIKTFNNNAPIISLNNEIL